MTTINAVTDLSFEGDIAIVSLNSPPVNALSTKVREGLLSVFRQASADPAAKAIILICEAKTFIARADKVRHAFAGGQNRLQTIDRRRTSAQSWGPVKLIAFLMHPG